MENVLVLIAAGLSAEHVVAAATVLRAVGAACGDPDWLAEGTACDLPFFGVDPAGAEEAVRAALEDAAIDIAAVAAAAADRRKMLLVADMDSTIIGQECLDELADAAGLGDRVAELTRRAMAGKLDFAEALAQRVAMLKGLPEQTLQRVFDERIRLNPGARTLLSTMAANGAHSALVSGGFRFFTSRVAAAAGFETFTGNELEITGGRLTGRVAGAIVGAEGKLAALRTETARHGLRPSLALATGDGANDVPMLRAAGLSVAYHAKPGVRDAATARIDHGDLTALLYLQGYHAAEFVAG